MSHNHFKGLPKPIFSNCNWNDISKRIQKENCSADNDIDSFQRLTSSASSTKPKRPTDLLNPRKRSESPNLHSVGQTQYHNYLSPPAKHDIVDTGQDLMKKNGVLNFGNETITATMADFEMGHCLGSGTCSSVYLATYLKKPTIVMAAKQMRRSSSSYEENKRIMKDLSVVTQSNSSRFIVQCFGIFISTEEVWICMEVMSTCLDKLLRSTQEPFPEDVVGKIAVSIIFALEYLKDRLKVMHRDVKPSNMLLSDLGVVKLCDFGISGQLKNSIARSHQLGCYGYMAPERLVKQSYDVRADVWSVGISILELATGEFPFKGMQSEFDLMSHIVQDAPPSLPPDTPTGPIFSSQFRQFVTLCLQQKIDDRPKYLQLKSLDFFRKHNCPPLDIRQWYHSLPCRRLAYQASPPSSGYASIASDNSPGSLCSQSRSPSASGALAMATDYLSITDNKPCPTDPNPSSGCLLNCFSRSGSQPVIAQTSYPVSRPLDPIRHQSITPNHIMGRSELLARQQQYWAPQQQHNYLPGYSASNNSVSLVAIDNANNSRTLRSRSGTGSSNSSNGSCSTLISRSPRHPPPTNLSSSPILRPGVVSPPPSNSCSSTPGATPRRCSSHQLPPSQPILSNGGSHFVVANNYSPASFNSPDLRYGGRPVVQRNDLIRRRESSQPPLRLREKSQPLQWVTFNES